MAARPKTASPTWNDVKSSLAKFDRSALVGLVQDMYRFSKDNQRFLHARFRIGADVLAPYKATIDRWLYPDVLKDQRLSVTAARRAIADYRKAAGEPEGLAELTAFFCESAVAFCAEYGLDDESYASALVRMFAEALKLSDTLADETRESMFERLDEVRRVGQALGYGVSDAMNDLAGRFGVAE